ncbi:hypothetical protein GCM10025858_06910 [Alicyclobacillus sacchari]|uniref:hypothetical protein n=1 Tax=Alicyclobacillus sacchari TaxID=392010 RepID=UPI0023EA473D|nr:hypothetical protein [Alicyclobacillus sacchari]GMA56188.1 hypothetical protein GCM10025858_06910 [Alicyclobacillus sacchari]
MQRWSDIGDQTRLLFIHGIWLVAILGLSAKLVAVMACLRLGSGVESNIRGQRWRIDLEHFRTEMVADGRGQIRFRDGTPWSRQMSRYSVASAWRQNW